MNNPQEQNMQQTNLQEPQNVRYQQQIHEQQQQNIPRQQTMTIPQTLRAQPERLQLQPMNQQVMQQPALQTSLPYLWKQFLQSFQQPVSGSLCRLVAVISSDGSSYYRALDCPQEPYNQQTRYGTLPQMIGW